MNYFTDAEWNLLSQGNNPVLTDLSYMGGQSQLKVNCIGWALNRDQAAKLLQQNEQDFILERVDTACIEVSNPKGSFGYHSGKYSLVNVYIPVWK